MIPQLGRELGFVDPPPPAGRGRARARSFDIDFIEFLSKAFAPIAENNGSRTDNEIVTGILNARMAKGTILDVCSGWPLLLEKLLEQLMGDHTRETEYHYVACDMMVSTGAFRNNWEKLAKKANLPNFKMSKIPIDVAEPGLLKNALPAVHKGKFDFILLANALHEIPPIARPELLLTLVELLADGGHLVLIDPDPDWLLDATRWERIKDLSDLKIDWEADAVWLPSATYRTILQKFGCTVRDNPVPRSQLFWVLQANRKPHYKLTARDKLIKEATAIIKKALLRQLHQQTERYVDCRDELGAELGKVGVRQNKRLLYKAVEFFSICASQAKRVEASKS